MPKCLACGKDIEHVLAQTDANQEIKADTSDMIWIIDHERIIYTCPECGTGIRNVENFDDAVNFMKNV